ncbi:MAG: hypothetical protein ACSHYA_20080 [Opitutaceae bacterium]
MKNISPISILALIISLAALGVTISKEKESLSPAEIDALVDAGIARKEKAYADFLRPKLEMIYRDMLTEEVFDGFEDEPETLDELFLPAFTVLKELTG